ncbi:YbaB/EbfC family nucleoid-associated protein [Actinocatenispora rupis]|uniref:YbaB/EbfC DNA-binding family protein n=1 Tax=Actinocatenispora rupis TaxID=519421 RepID=A0A8J3NC68_9ACTN|nr:YbaB/EbfC family nucleoid-associated protein [Actinocatenispora rupis]GID11555.1 hypothetical protein Aru02nite_24440 [Actinocatenispora rupis]
MGELADRLDQLQVRISSPDGRITAVVSGRGRPLGVELPPAAYHRYAEATLAHQLAQLGRLGYAAYRREYRQLTDAAIDRPVHDDMPDVAGPRLREYRARVATIASHGDGGDGRVRLGARGLAEWTVSIRTGVTRSAPVGEFLGWLHTALARLLADHHAQAGRIHRAVYEEPVPDVPVSDDAPYRVLGYWRGSR